MIHYGLGKWYPGEPLPRWQYGLFWRKDHYPIWKNIRLVAHEKIEKKFTWPDAERFTKELAKHLAVSENNLSTAYEDIFYFLWSEGKLPANVDPLLSNLKDSIERRTLSHLLDSGLENPAGFALPLKWNYDNSKWQSCKWFLSRKVLFLIPGNSPMGLRLPLDSRRPLQKKMSPRKWNAVYLKNFPCSENYHETITSRYGLVYEHPAPKQKIKYTG